MLLTILLIIASYLIGSVPSAYIVGKLSRGIDIRNFGSGNVGATNTFRVLGKGWGVLVFILDALKGVIPVTLLASFAISQEVALSGNTLRIILGLASVCGHNWTVFLRFKGGKGVATTFGVLIGLLVTIASIKIILALTLLVWLVIFIIFRIVSIASIISSISMPIFMLVYKQQLDLIIMSVVLCIFIIWRHKSNIKKILEGKEKPINLIKKNK